MGTRMRSQEECNPPTDLQAHVGLYFIHILNIPNGYVSNGEKMESCNIVPLKLTVLLWQKMFLIKNMLVQNSSCSNRSGGFQGVTSLLSVGDVTD